MGARRNSRSEVSSLHNASDLHGTFRYPGAQTDLAGQRGTPTPEGLQSNLRPFCLGNRNIG
jgi:hypothetical protein